MPYDQLQYRGHYGVTCGIDFAGTMLSAEKGGGYREDEVIFPPLRQWRLGYSDVNRKRMVQLPSGEALPREDYLWQFYLASKTQGNRPFLMRCPRVNKLFLCVFPEDIFEIELLNLTAMSTGLTVRQVYVRGVATSADGSIDEGVLLP